MARIPNCKGSYFKRKDSSKWEIKYPIGWNKIKGTYDYYHETLSSEPEAIIALKSINEYLYFGGIKTKQSIYFMRRQKELEELKIKKEALVTFEEFANEYNELRKEQKQISNRTYDSYCQIIRRVKPYIGDLPLASITTQDIDKMYSKMRSENNDNASGKGYTGTTLCKTHAVLNKIFEHAIDYDVIDKNPLNKVQKPKVDTQEKDALTEEQAQNLFNLITKQQLNPNAIGLLLGLLCGTRLSEMLALTWNDLNNDTITICKSLEKDSQNCKPPKNGETRRVTVPQSLLKILDEWKKEQKKYFSKTIILTWSNNTPIVNNKWGIHQVQSNYNRWFRNYKKKLNLPSSFTYHQLRHTYITFLFRNCGVDERTTRELSGHKSMQAFARYTHTNDEWKLKATDKLNNIFISKQTCKNCSQCNLWSPSPDLSLGTCWKNNTPQTTEPNYFCNSFIN